MIDSPMERPPAPPAAVDIEPPRSPTPPSPTADSGPAPDELEMEVFRTGDYGAKGVYGPADLDAIIVNYDSRCHEAPLTFDHAQEGPARGWVATLRRAGDRLIARLRGLTTEAREAIARGVYKKPSVELYLPGPERPSPALKAVSLLGARIPEVKGLASPSFSEGGPSACPALPEGVVAVGASERSVPENRFAASPVSAPAAPVASPAPSRSAIDARALVDRLRRRGKFPPAWDRAGLPKFLERLGELERCAGASGGAAAFSEGPSAAQWLASFLESSGGLCLGSVADPPPSAGDSPSERFRLPDTEGRSPVSASSVELHRAATRFLAGDPSMTYAQALRRAASGAGRRAAF
jgi:hypothetical protein